jgi:hypothetical protein
MTRPFCEIICSPEVAREDEGLLDAWALKFQTSLCLQQKLR